jgi:phospholipase D1/2
LTPFSRGVGIHVHAKLMIVDDRFVTMGSANLANRSMGVDSEINLAIEQAQASPVIRGWRHELIAEHLGVDPRKLAEVEEERGSIIASIAALNDPDATHYCRPLQLELADLPSPLEEMAELGDPTEPLVPDQILGPSLPLRERRRVRRWVGRVLGLAGIVLIIASWQGPLAAAISVWLALPAGLVLVALWVAAERLWRPGLH